MQTVTISISRKKNGRSAFLSRLMKALSGELGEDATQAYQAKDREKLASAFRKVYAEVVKGM